MLLFYKDVQDRQDKEGVRNQESGVRRIGTQYREPILLFPIPFFILLILSILVNSSEIDAFVLQGCTG